MSTERADLLDQLYPGAGRRVADELERVASLEVGARPRPRPIDQSDVWAIAYPDHVTSPAVPPLRSLDEALRSHLTWVTGVHVLPLHPATGDGGFAVADYDTVDAAYGSWDDVARLGGRRRLMLDLVCNHTSSAHRWFEEFCNGSRPGWYRTREDSERVDEVARPRPGTPTTSFDVDGSVRDVWTTFSPDQVDLDYRNPEVLIEMTRVLAALVARGASVVRLDAIAYLWKSTSGTRLNESATHQIVSVWRSLLDDHAPGTLLIAEVNLPEAQNVAYLGTTDRPEAHGVYQFTLPPLVLDALAHGDPSMLAQWVTESGSNDPPGLRLNFLSSHDGVGIRPIEDRIGEARRANLIDRIEAAGLAVNHYAAADGTSVPYELTGTWFDLVKALVGRAQAQRAAIGTYAVAFALSGVPLVYLNALFARRSDTAAARRSGSSRDLNRGRLAATTLRADRRAALSAAAFEQLARHRASSLAFAPEAAQRAWANRGVLHIEREHPDGHSAAVAVNFSAEVVDSLPPYGHRWRT